MNDKRVTVWVQRFKYRKSLMLQWIDPDTGKRKTKSSNTADEDEAEDARASLEYELRHGKYQEPSKLDWEHFRELFETEYLAGLRERTRATRSWIRSRTSSTPRSFTPSQSERSACSSKACESENKQEARSGWRP